MYRESAERIEAGLSPGASWTLGIFSALIGAMMLAIADQDQLLGFSIVAGFCFVIALTCVLRGRPRQFFGSLTGISLFTMGCWYLIEQILGGSILSGTRSEPSVLNATLFLFFIGMPGLLYAVRAKFGLARPNKGFNRTPESSGPAKPGESGGGAG